MPTPTTPKPIATQAAGARPDELDSGEPAAGEVGPAWPGEGAGAFSSPGTTTVLVSDFGPIETTCFQTTFPWATASTMCSPGSTGIADPHAARRTTLPSR